MGIGVSPLDPTALSRSLLNSEVGLNALAGSWVDEPPLAQRLAVVDERFLEIAAGEVVPRAIGGQRQAAFEVPTDEGAVRVDADLQAEAAAVAAHLVEKGVGNARGDGDGVVAEDSATVEGPRDMVRWRRLRRIGRGRVAVSPLNTQMLWNAEVGTVVRSGSSPGRCHASGTEEQASLLIEDVETHDLEQGVDLELHSPKHSKL